MGYKERKDGGMQKITEDGARFTIYPGSDGRVIYQPPEMTHGEYANSLKQSSKMTPEALLWNTFDKK